MSRASKSCLAVFLSVLELNWDLEGSSGWKLKNWSTPGSSMAGPIGCIQTQKLMFGFSSWQDFGDFEDEWICDH